MKTLTYTIDIKAPAAKIWFVLWDDKHYKEWTSVFSLGSYAVSDWKEGSKIQFLTPEGDGMYSVIDQLIPNKKLVFKHLGEIKKYKELASDSKKYEWSGFIESYELKEHDDTTTLTVKSDVADNFIDFMEDAFPKALKTVKNLAEDLSIHIETEIEKTPDQIWKYWTQPEHIINWNSANADWHTPHAQNDLKINGRFLFRMEAKDGSMGFDFGGTYLEVEPMKKITYKMDDGRKVDVEFLDANGKTKVIERFQPENTNPLELQRDGWQSILNNFKEYAEKN